MSNMPSTKSLFTFFAIGAGLAVLALFVYTQVREEPGDTRLAYARQQQASSATNQTADGWTIGQLHPDSSGLRIIPRGRSDASAVLNPEQFAHPEVRHAYWIATQIPATLNKLYCWCGCENRGVHRSNLGCFEDHMGVNCAVCRDTAEIAYRMVQDGVTDAGKIQATVDMEWGPEWAKTEQQNRQG